MKDVTRELDNTLELINKLHKAGDITVSAKSVLRFSIEQAKTKTIENTNNINYVKLSIEALKSQYAKTVKMSRLDYNSMATTEHSEYYRAILECSKKALRDLQTIEDLFNVLKT